MDGTHETGIVEQSDCMILIVFSEEYDTPTWRVAR